MAALAAVPYLLTVGVNPPETRLAIVWLQALGVHAMVVNGPQSSDEYKNFHQPERFDAVLPVLHRELGDTIYAIPQRTASLAHVLHADEAAPAAPSGVPGNLEIMRYVDAIEDPRRAEAQCWWLNSGKPRPYA